MASPGQESQASPRPSPSVFVWLVLATVGQLSSASQRPSPSVSLPRPLGQESQGSPKPSPSASAWVGFATAGQLSRSPVLGALKPVPAQIPSASGSLRKSEGHTSQPSPSPSPSASAWVGLVKVGQLSQAFPLGSWSPLA